jgi:hypothetical protein
MSSSEPTIAPETSTSLPTIDLGDGARAVERVSADEIGVAMNDARSERFHERVRLSVATIGSTALHLCVVVALGLSLAKPTSLSQGPGLETLISTHADPITPVPPPEQPIEVPPDPHVQPDHSDAARATASNSISKVLTPSVAPPKISTAVAKHEKLKQTQLESDLFSSSTLLAGLEQGQQKVQLGAIRSPGQRLQAVLYRGGSRESEKAVERALEWMLKHQASDGGWTFDHRTCGDCNGRCRNPGTMASARIGATSLALLPFLAAGETHKTGKHRRHVENGLKFLVRSMQTTPQGGAFTAGGGSFYSQSLATIVLCEALAMTRDRDLVAPARAATAYILAAQDPQGGGWRYFPGQPGDTSVTGWAFNALKSADNAYQPVPTPAIDKVRAFLDSVQIDEGAAYGYLTPDDATTASTPVGLLCRMQLGWKRTEPALIRGVAALAAEGPKPNNIYYNFYATQVVHHFGGPSWEQWNKQMREQLIRTQATAGHEAGSWYFEETTPHDQLASAVGGRLYNTALATLTLEVYYRHLPLYGNRIFDEEGSPEAVDTATPAAVSAKPQAMPGATASGPGTPTPAPPAPVPSASSPAATTGSGRKP